MTDQLSSIEAAVEAIAAGKVVISMDDIVRENEGEFYRAAEKVTPEIVDFMITHGRGQLCMPILPEAAARLQLGRSSSRTPPPCRRPLPCRSIIAVAAPA